MSYSEQAQSLMLGALTELEALQRGGYQPETGELLRLLDVTTKFYPAAKQQVVISSATIEKARQFGLLINEVSGF